MSNPAPPPRRNVRWKESEVCRLIRAGKKEGVTLQVEIAPDGTLRGVPVAEQKEARDSCALTPDDELERWRKEKRGTCASA